MQRFSKCSPREHKALGQKNILSFLISECHHGTARPQVVEERTASISWVATNILNKQSRTADNLKFGQGANKFSP
jgi:hypothetical protein